MGRRKRGYKVVATTVSFKEEDLVKLNKNQIKALNLAREISVKAVTAVAENIKDSNIDVDDIVIGVSL